MTLQDYFARTFAQRAARARNFKAVGEAGMDKVMLGEGMDLGLVLQPSKGMGKNDPIVILLEGTSRRLSGR